VETSSEALFSFYYVFYSTFRRKKLAGEGFLPQAAWWTDVVFKEAPCSSPATTSMLLKFQWHCMRVWKLRVKRKKAC